MVPGGIVDLAPWSDWDSAARGALRFLHEHLGWDVWLVTQVDGDVQRVVHSHPGGAVRPGTELAWERSLCRQMIEGRAPRVATVTAAVPEYASRTTGVMRQVAAYVGAPLVTRDLQLYGTLCAVAFRAKPRSAARDLALVETTGRMLSTLLAASDDRGQDDDGH